MTDRRPADFSADYHDYVFRDGRLVGDFDNMYRHAAGVPWDQDTRCREWYAQVGLLMIGSRAPYRSILEAGCGLGYITARLQPYATEAIDAFDVSADAIRKAAALHPGIGFYVADLRDPDFAPRRVYDLVVIRDVFWYVTDVLETVLRNLDRSVAPGGYLYVGQSFPALDRPFVGRDVLPSPDALLDRLHPYAPVFSARIRNHELASDGPILHFLGRKAS